MFRSIKKGACALKTKTKTKAGHVRSVTAAQNSIDPCSSTKDATQDAFHAVAVEDDDRTGDLNINNTLMMAGELSCPICLSIAEDAVETSCCHHIFCKMCLNKNAAAVGCPQCRRRYTIHVSHVARRIIGNMPTNCSYEDCGMALPRSNVKDHERSCIYRSFNCPLSDCTFQGKKPAFLSHLIGHHGDVMAENAPKLLLQSSRCTETVDDIIVTKSNDAGRIARIGENGKYYCYGDLGEFKCDCCDGSCGPTNGCNCKDCMKLDVLSRKLPTNYFVNREGAICRKRAETGRFYCGRKVMTGVEGCDGYCGPNDGPNCRSCVKIQEQFDTRYGDVWS